MTQRQIGTDEKLFRMNLSIDQLALKFSCLEQKLNMLIEKVSNPSQIMTEEQISMTETKKPDLEPARLAQANAHSSSDEEELEELFALIRMMYKRLRTKPRPTPAPPLPKQTEQQVASQQPSSLTKRPPALVRDSELSKAEAKKRQRAEALCVGTVDWKKLVLEDDYKIKRLPP